MSEVIVGKFYSHFVKDTVLEFNRGSHTIFAIEILRRYILRLTVALTLHNDLRSIAVCRKEMVEILCLQSCSLRCITSYFK